MIASHILITLSLLIILSDSLINYFINIYFHRLPILSIVPFFLLIYLIINQKILRKIDTYHYVIIVIGISGYLVGILSIDDVSANRLYEVISAFVAWFVGYLWVVSHNKKLNWNWIILISFIHATVSTVALMKILPSYLPVVNKLWSFDGVLMPRPEVSTDQNFQIFYFLPLAAMILFYNNKKQAFFTGFGLAMCAYTLSALQTRSGILVLGCTIMLGIVIHFFCTGGNKTRALIYSVLISFFVLGVALYKYDAINILIVRFTNVDYSTAYGRLNSFLYFFEKVCDLWWWIPRGNTEFMLENQGQIPHSNITAQLLDGGIVGVFVWFILIVSPTVKIGLHLFLKENKVLSDHAIVFALTVGSLVTQLSLNVPFMDIVWLYGGIAAGVASKINNTVKRNKLSLSRK